MGECFTQTVSDGDLMNYSSSPATSVPVSAPSCDSWGLFQFVSTGGSVGPVTLAHSGISAATRVVSGIYSISFKRPQDYRSGAYYVAVTPEINNDTDVVNVFGVVDRNLTQNRQSPRSENKEFFRIANINPFSGSAPTDFNIGDPLTSYRANCAVFCFATGATATGITFEAETRNLILNNTQIGANFWNLSTVGVTLNTEIAPDFSKTASMVSNLSNGPGNAYVWADSVGLSFDTTPRTFTASVYAKAVNRPGITSESFYLWLNTGGKQSLYNFSAAQDGSLLSSTLNYGTGTPTHSGHYYEIEKAGNRWVRFSMTITVEGMNGSDTIRLGFFPSGGASGFTTGASIYLWGAQLEEGSVKTPLIYTSSTAVVGDQDSRRSLVPGARGFGVSGPTYSTAIPNIVYNRTATAYGTIVIPGNKGWTSGNRPVAYLENAFNTKGVSLGYNAGLSAGGTASYSLLFTTPMKDANYCVILSSEKETAIENEETSSQDAPEWEWCIPYVRGQKTVNGFKVEVARPASSGVSVPWRTEPTMYQNGRTERIHYMVFGGKTYGIE